MDAGVCYCFIWRCAASERRCTAAEASDAPRRAGEVALPPCRLMHIVCAPSNLGPESAEGYDWHRDQNQIELNTLLVGVWHPFKYSSM